MFELNGKIALVTGGKRGIGLAIVEAFVHSGATVVVTDWDDSGDLLPPGVEFLRMDVSSGTDWDEVRQWVDKKYDRLDILVNNAGIASYPDVVELTEEGWEEVIGVDQKGVWLGMRAAIPLMRKAGQGAIVNISSIAGAAARPGIHGYHAAKGAVLSMSANAAVTYAAENIRVNAVVPGFIATPLTAVQDAEISNEYIAKTPLGHPGSPHDVAAAVTYLVSDDAAFVTGIALPVDGGYLAG